MVVSSFVRVELELWRLAHSVRAKYRLIGEDDRRNWSRYHAQHLSSIPRKSCLDGRCRRTWLEVVRVLAGCAICPPINVSLRYYYSYEGEIITDIDSGGLAYHDN